MQVDLVESYAQGRITRRQFAQRAAVIGLSLPFVSAVIAACGDDDSTSGTTTTAGGGTATTSAGPTTSGGPAKQGGTIRVGVQVPGALDPIAMQDLGAYGIVAQSFEFLAALGEDGGIAPGLAEKWTPNDKGDVWTFDLRKGVKWQDGKDFTSKDVAATMDRLVEAGNSGLKGVIDKGAVDSTDPNVAKFTLVGPNGNFPSLVSCFNAQSCITPVDYATGTTLDKVKNGTGPWILEKFDAQTGCTFKRNDAWWGGKTPLDSTQFTFFNDVGTMVTGMQGGAVDALVQFSVIGGDALLNSPDFQTLDLKTATHRQIWMRCDKGQFKDKRVRQALALTFDREQMLQTLFRGRAEIGNDHVIAPLYPYFDGSVPQRKKDIEKAKQLLKDAGAEGLSAKLQIANLQEIPQLAQLIAAGAGQAGIKVEINTEDTSTFYGNQWCPAEPADPPCSGAAELGIVDYGHRPTPDIFCNAALKSNGIWNSSQYASKDFDAAFAEFQGSLELDGQKAACKKMETILNEDVPVGLPFFYNLESGYSKKFTGVRVAAIGQMYLDKASQA